MKTKLCTVVGRLLLSVGLTGTFLPVVDCLLWVRSLADFETELCFFCPSVVCLIVAFPVLACGEDGEIPPISNGTPQRPRPSAGGLFRHFRDFLDAFLTDKLGQVAVDRLAPAIIDPVRPFLPPGRHYLLIFELYHLYRQAARALEGQELYARKQAAVIEAHCTLQRAQARAVYLETLTTEERAALDLRLRAEAKAQARAKTARMAEEIAALKRELAEVRGSAPSP